MTTGRIVTRWTTVLFAAALAALPAATGYAQDATGKKKGGKKGGEVVDVATLPADVTDAVKKALPDCKIESGTRKTGKKGDAYTLSLSKDGKTCTAELAPGKNGGLQGDLVETIDASALSKRLTKAADAEAAGGKITKVEKLTGIPDGEIQYRLEIDDSGTAKTVTLTEKGKVVPAPGERKKKDEGAGAGAAAPASGAAEEKKDAGAAAPAPTEKKE